MDVLIDTIINQFETGKLTRRKMIESLAVAAMTVYGAGKLEGSEVLAAAPAPEMMLVNRPHLDAILINHVSYTCADYRKARDFYAEVMGMEVLGDKATDAKNPQYGQANLLFGPHPYGVTSKDATPYGAPAGTPMSFIIVRSRNPNPAPRADAAAPATPAAGTGQRANAPAQPQSQVTIDHMAYTIADWDAARVEEILKARGLNPRKDTENSFHVIDQDGYDLQICGVGMTAYN